ncbi:molybdenum cofactor biosynthesis protein MoaB [Virgibacillus pantothenticus]|uniref:Molybdenum cofactor biosynthesis protein B n=1 Tax=Virgibacillus pantothenticus TaxID=1473 RepID=A0A0L0QVL6_VIRPA|nr:molybdenum cofactor biosynthesis protein B [Virgibacillus pantothenticus]KNE22562.1 molybdenum cofactor biosynthesis protein B [Virgibacillus pantothenticus]MBU8567788.1 molybdenum cofactor biosynthesis protein MoaB [Virgibacillus pantothenticus]MBU8601581.1 molybdenum cofactor biosynthesis protein MoaB [Virgibacillus pantothenticus]MBU8635810.1 molybdenum cofactor biosynthesis protein MoaB [Virgibacillus pantothenticus]MBU8643516.1 molybdenum cofactor biosynthesis protein MoaB [Virgibacill
MLERQKILRLEVLTLLRDHRKSSPKAVTCAILTVSDTRNKETDKSGKLIKSFLEKEGHAVHAYDVIPDEKADIQAYLNNYGKEVEAVIINGGTGISHRDVTIEAVKPLLEKELPGFGELFRMLSYQLDIGSASILSRAIAGVSQNRIVFAIPGSSGAVRLAMEKLILLELRHLVMEVRKDLERK